MRRGDAHLLRLEELREHFEERVEQSAGQQHAGVARGEARYANVLPAMQQQPLGIHEHREGEGGPHEHSRPERPVQLQSKLVYTLFARDARGERARCLTSDTGAERRAAANNI